MLDVEGVGRLMKLAVAWGRGRRAHLKEADFDAGAFD